MMTENVGVGPGSSGARGAGGARMRHTPYVTVTTTAEDVVLLPALSTATAVKVCWPLDVFRVFQANLYGEFVVVETTLPSR